MHSFGFLFSRRWLVFAVVVVLLGYAAWWLGTWQFDRLDDRRNSNAVIRTNEALDPAPVSDVLAPDRVVDGDDEWRLVAATGTYDVDDTIIVRYRSRDGRQGVDVVVPLVTADGTSLVVDRGFVPTGSREIRPADVPAPPTGEVDITGWVRTDGTGDSTAVDDQSTRAISSAAIGDALDREVYGGFVDLRSEDPEPTSPLQRAELPELDSGPHFFYGIQWWFFGVLAVFGFGYLAYDERKRGPRGERPQRARRTRRDVGQGERTNEDVGDSTKVETRASSAGSP